MYQQISTEQDIFQELQKMEKMLTTRKKEVPEDAIDLSEDVSHIVDTDLHITNYYLSMTVTKNIHDAQMNEEYKGVFEAYDIWKEKCLDELRESLQAYFPDRWEVKVGTPPAGGSKTKICKELYACKGNMNGFNPSNVDARHSCKIIIHFPEILISNSNGTTWTIKDFYVIMLLGPRLELMEINGYRATKSYREYKSGYNHSHSKASVNSITSFCFGSTSLDTLVGELKFSAFDGPRIDLLLQNLTDYLSWESLEGHPYKSIDEVKNINLGRSTVAEFTSSISNKILKAVALAKPDISINITNDLVRVPKNMSLVRTLTPYVPDELKYPIDEINLITVYPFRTNVAEIKAAIKVVNENEKSNTIFTFKNENVHLVVEDIEDEEMTEGVVEKYADMRVVDDFVSTIESGLTRHLHDRFWYGTEKRSAQ